MEKVAYVDGEVRYDSKDRCFVLDLLVGEAKQRWLDMFGDC